MEGKNTIPVLKYSINVQESILNSYLFCEREITSSRKLLLAFKYIYIYIYIFICRDIYVGYVYICWQYMYVNILCI